MIKTTGNKLIHNHKLEDIGINHNMPYCTGTTIYEVLRIEQGVPLFFNDHYMRLHNSCTMAGLQISIEKSDLLQSINKLIEGNKIFDANIRFNFCFTYNTTYTFWAAFLDTKYPPQEMYQKGVACGIMFIERDNPNAKIQNLSLREKSTEQMKEEHTFENILINHHNQITEGSRSNIFFVKGNTLYTSPTDLVLPGVMRKQVIEIINELNIDLKYEAIDYKEIELYNSAFLTGTSPRVLPVKQIGKHAFNTNCNITKKIMDVLHNKIKEYIHNFK